MGEEKPKLNFSGTESQFKMLGKGEHIDQISDRLADVYRGHTKGKRKLSSDEAKALANKLYDELGAYLHEDYFKRPGKAKSAKGPHGDSDLDSLVETYFGVSRKKMETDLVDHADNKGSFSQRYLNQFMNQHYETHTGVRQGKELEKFGPQEMDSVKQRIKQMIADHKLDPKEYTAALKSKDYRKVNAAYGNLASQYGK